MLLPLCLSSALYFPAAQIVGGEFGTHLSITNPGANDLLGSSVASIRDLDGDGVRDFLVGAPGASPGGFQGLGSAFVYSGASGAELLRVDGELPGDLFGNRVAAVGDYDHDGTDDFLVGSPGADPGGLYGALIDAGSAFLYSGATGSLLQRFDGSTGGMAFGSDLATEGDLNGDGISDFLIGAPEASPNRVQRAGMVFAFSGADGSLLYELSATQQQHSYFGFAVSFIGDQNGDGHDDFAVGVPSAYFQGNRVGGVFLYSGATGEEFGRRFGKVIGGNFGWSLDSCEDIDGDGHREILVGEVGRDLQGPDPGQALVLSSLDGRVLRRFQDGTARGRTGHSVAAVGDVDGDGLGDILIGAPDAKFFGAQEAGAAFLYSLRTGELLHQFDDSGYQDHLGYAVCDMGDLNGDGLVELGVGAPGSPGVAFVYSLDPFMVPRSRTVSAQQGGNISLRMDFPDTHAGEAYRVLLSSSGIGPNNHLGIDVPLTADRWFQSSQRGVYPANQHRFMNGYLDAEGKAIAYLSFPPGLPSTFLGRRLFLASVAGTLGMAPSASSVANIVEIQP